MRSVQNVQRTMTVGIRCSEQLFCQSELRTVSEKNFQNLYVAQLDIVVYIAMLSIDKACFQTLLYSTVRMILTKINGSGNSGLILPLQSVSVCISGVKQRWCSNRHAINNGLTGGRQKKIIGYLPQPNSS